MEPPGLCATLNLFVCVEAVLREGVSWDRGDGLGLPARLAQWKKSQRGQ